MGSNEILVTVAVLFIGLMLFCGIFWLWICARGGALQLFAFAAEQDFLGIIAYIAAWVFIFFSSNAGSLCRDWDSKKANES